MEICMLMWPNLTTACNLRGKLKLGEFTASVDSKAPNSPVVLRSLVPLKDKTEATPEADELSRRWRRRWRLAKLCYSPAWFTSQSEVFKISLWLLPELCSVWFEPILWVAVVHPELLVLFILYSGISWLCHRGMVDQEDYNLFNAREDLASRCP
uniref:Uncharacterized protein n=1 Tax=Nelumbo nucifera TaxID=4432 RepID=A0A822ZKS4_NELNU|nr:TPA_asm: hypothetical protein HUJ06_002265 [Nelumbo nucifera]